MGNLVLLDGNKISGGINYITPECYSTEERVVGCWIDGKPLYQKTYVKNNVGSNNEIVDANMTLSNITIVGFINNGIEMNSPYSGEVFKEYVSSAVVLRVFNSASGLQCNLEGNHNYTGNVRFTVQYTKVSDTAGSGIWTPSGIPAVHFSTEEQAIGTWIDGKTLYQKSFAVNWGTSAVDINLGFTPDTIMFVPDATFKKANSDGNTCYLGYYASGEDNCQAYYRASTHQIRCKGCGSNFVGTGYVTVRYTKSAS